ncbi:uncharacterized protein LOC119097645 [Pollicipes pollicipes]|uniref:uncharacterized protein LOC119097645 n=1 Tax=Pollicipes pollicipes TaxID=41117 RepID=UPI0018856AB9|nr:uncharacterized protein LOC119097645 [Pollicipes pollicipes]
MRSLLIVLLAVCAGRAAGRAAPNNVQTVVAGSQTGFTTGGGSLVGSARGAAAAASQRVFRVPGHTQLDTRASNGAVTLQGASAGHGQFAQQGSVLTGTNSHLGSVTAGGVATNKGASHNAALGNAVTGAASGRQRVSQAGVLVNPGGQRVGQVNTGLDLSAVASVAAQGAVRGTGTFGGTNTLTATSRHVSPVALPGAALPGGNVLVGVGQPAVAAPPAPAMNRGGGMMGMMGGMRRGRGGRRHKD